MQVSSLLCIEKWRTTVNGSLKSICVRNQPVLVGDFEFRLAMTFVADQERILPILVIIKHYSHTNNQFKGRFREFEYHVEVLADDCLSTEKIDDQSFASIHWKEDEDGNDFIKESQSIEIPFNWEDAHHGLYHCSDVTFKVHLRAKGNALRYNEKSPVNQPVNAISYIGFNEKGDYEPTYLSFLDKWASDCDNVNRVHKLFNIGKRMMKTPSRRRAAIALLEEATRLLESDEGENTRHPKDKHFLRISDMYDSILGFARRVDDNGGGGTTRQLQWRFAIICRFLDPYNPRSYIKIAEILIRDLHDTHLGLEALLKARELLHPASGDAEDMWLGFIEILERDAYEVERKYELSSMCNISSSKKVARTESQKSRKKRSTQAKRDRLKRKKATAWQEAHPDAYGVISMETTDCSTPIPSTLDESSDNTMFVESTETSQSTLNLSPSTMSSLSEEPSSLPSSLPSPGSTLYPVASAVSPSIQCIELTKKVIQKRKSYMERVSWVAIAEETEEEELARLAPWTAYAEKMLKEDSICTRSEPSYAFILKKGGGVEDNKRDSGGCAKVQHDYNEWNSVAKNRTRRRKRN